MTPGTVVLGISDDRKIYIHSIDFSTKEEEVEGIKSSLERVVRDGRRLMLKIIMIIALIVVAISMLAMFVRIIKGPTLADRILALDAIGLQLMACIALYSIFIGSEYLLVAILLIGILAFLGTAVFSKYMDKGKVIERDNEHHH